MIALVVFLLFALACFLATRGDYPLVSEQEEHDEHEDAGVG